MGPGPLACTLPNSVLASHTVDLIQPQHTVQTNLQLNKFHKAQFSSDNRI
ncbi:Os12g0157150 [Oryza sativa Japonica Group]|uniref:Os12g0157150 protein n=1 Tax=Oryza sativa subsp. japonica TaxID=39947 RepID=C7J9H7_ORYSJ|nr:Os12g0157150 [Oryza sativa Japonica Group]|eukprot:NP_001176801.1 Os12g0157150 [Oryza sativa Japonica Group]